MSWNLLKFFREWLELNEEKKQFMEMWESHYKKDINFQNNACTGYHKEIAYEIYKMQEEIESLKNTINYLESRDE
jgi:hypothetical protein